jgi:hypothetical protein
MFSITKAKRIPQIEFDPTRPEIKTRFREITNDGYLNLNDLKRSLS